MTTCSRRWHCEELVMDEDQLLELATNIVAAVTRELSDRKGIGELIDELVRLVVIELKRIPEGE